MAARFTQGASIQTTRTTRPPNKVAPPQSNSMKGLPGFVKTKQDASDGGLTDAKGVGPHREGPIGRKGHGGAGYMDGGKFRGSSDKSYRATSTGPAGSISSNKGTPHARGASEKEGPKRGKPSRGAPQIGGGRGTMESLRGRAKFSSER